MVGVFLGDRERAKESYRTSKPEPETKERERERERKKGERESLLYFETVSRSEPLHLSKFIYSLIIFHRANQTIQGAKALECIVMGGGDERRWRDNGDMRENGDLRDKGDLRDNCDMRDNCDIPGTRWIFVLLKRGNVRFPAVLHAGPVFPPGFVAGDHKHTHEHTLAQALTSTLTHTSVMLTKAHHTQPSLPVTPGTHTHVSSSSYDTHCYTSLPVTPGRH